MKINFSNFIEALIRIGEHTCPTEQKLNNIIIGFVEEISKNSKRSLAFSYKFYTFEKEVAQIIKENTAIMTKIYKKELEQRLINTDDENEKEHTVMNFRILIALLK